MARKEWVMVRIPPELQEQLVALGASMEGLEVRQQGNHDDNARWGPPLWRIIAELARRDQDHRERSRMNNRKKASSLVGEVTKGSSGEPEGTSQADEGGVNTDPSGKVQGDLFGRRTAYDSRA